MALMLNKIMNQSEEITYSRLRSVCKNYGSSVYPKVRLADVLCIEGSGISQEKYRFALQAHFDFIVTDSEHQPLFAVEFDGSRHLGKPQKKRDIVKNELCERFKLPLLRINSNYLLRRYRNMDLLSWFVEVWFLAKSFYDAQENGIISIFEPFDPMSILAISDREKKWPLCLSIEQRSAIRKLYKTGKIKDPIPSCFVGIEDNCTYRGIAYVRIDDQTGVFAMSGMQNQNFPIVDFDLSQVLEELVIHEVYESLMSVLNNRSQTQPLCLIHDKVISFRTKYAIMLASYFRGGVGDFSYLPI